MLKFLYRNKKIIIGSIFLTIFSMIFTIGILAYILKLTPSRLGDIVRFALTVHCIENNFVEKVEIHKLFDVAIDAMVNSLGDPYSSYLDQDKYKKLIEQTEASFGGVGIVMGFRDNKVFAVYIMENTPAFKQGMKIGDEIISVDGKKVADMAPDEIAMHIRGEIGTEVLLEIQREDKKIAYQLRRDNIHITTAKGEMLENNIGYIRILSFSENTDTEFINALEKLKKEGMEGLILDVRANPGGLLSAVVNISRYLVPKGVIVSVKGRNGKEERYLSENEDINYPLILLIDGHSASASEILAGALKDTKRATLIGEKTFGKGSVQAVIPLSTKEALKLTTAKYYTPSGVSIHEKGVEPDIEVKQDVNTKEDMVLKRAVEELTRKINH